MVIQWWRHKIQLIDKSEKGSRFTYIIYTKSRWVGCPNTAFTLHKLTCPFIWIKPTATWKRVQLYCTVAQKNQLKKQGAYFHVEGMVIQWWQHEIHLIDKSEKGSRFTYVIYKKSRWVGCPNPAFTLHNLACPVIWIKLSSCVVRGNVECS
jgi:hypothetical protein